MCTPMIRGQSTADMGRATGSKYPSCTSGWADHSWHLDRLYHPVLFVHVELSHGGIHLRVELVDPSLTSRWSLWDLASPKRCFLCGFLRNKADNSEFPTSPNLIRPTRQLLSYTLHLRRIRKISLSPPPPPRKSHTTAQRITSLIQRTSKWSQTRRARILLP